MTTSDLLVSALGRRWAYTLRIDIVIISSRTHALDDECFDLGDV